MNLTEPLISAENAMHGELNLRVCQVCYVTKEHMACPACGDGCCSDCWKRWFVKMLPKRKCVKCPKSFTLSDATVVTDRKWVNTTYAEHQCRVLSEMDAREIPNTQPLLPRYRHWKTVERKRMHAKARYEHASWLWTSNVNRKLLWERYELLTKESTIILSEIEGNADGSVHENSHERCADINETPEFLDKLRGIASRMNNEVFGRMVYFAFRPVQYNPTTMDQAKLLNRLAYMNGETSKEEYGKVLQELEWRDERERIKSEIEESVKGELREKVMSVYHEMAAIPDSGDPWLVQTMSELFGCEMTRKMWNVDAVKRYMIDKCLREVRDIRIAVNIRIIKEFKHLDREEVLVLNSEWRLAKLNDL